MQRSGRELTVGEMIDALNGIIDIIIDCYNKPLADRYETRSTRIGKDITRSLLRKGILERYSNIGWRAQRYLLENDILKIGGIINEEESDEHQ